jgi:hypothetical protein
VKRHGRGGRAAEKKHCQDGSIWGGEAIEKNPLNSSSSSCTVVFDDSAILEDFKRKSTDAS